MSLHYILALDVGGRRIGVAMASTIARLPAPLTVIDREVSKDAMVDIMKLVEAHQVGVVVVGLPRGMQGQETAQTKATRVFAANLAERLQVPVVLQDEAGTSIQAEATLKEQGKTYTKGDIDAEAASIILNDYLQTHMDRTA